MTGAERAIRWSTVAAVAGIAAATYAAGRQSERITPPAPWQDRARWAVAWRGPSRPWRRGREHVAAAGDLESALWAAQRLRAARLGGRVVLIDPDGSQHQGGTL